MIEDLLQNMFKSTELHDAVAEGDVERVRQLLANGANVNARAFINNTPLMDACGGEMTVLRQGLNQAKKMKDLTAEDPKSSVDKISEFMRDMPRLGSKEMLAQIHRKREPNDTLPEDDTTIVRLLLQHGADVNAVDQSGYSALMKAVMTGRTETARILLERDADIWAQDNDNLTALMLAAQSRRLEAVELLLQHGANADYRTPKGYTTLMAAANGGRVEIAKLLLRRRQDVNTVGVNGQTALIIAALQEHEDMVAFLKDAGANIGFLESVALQDAALAHTLPPIRPKMRGPEWGYTCLFRAVKWGRADLVALLLERGVNPNAATQHGRSALMSAVMQDDLDCARLLLDAGAEVMGAEGSNFTPIGWASQQGYSAMMELLQARGASVNQTTKDGATPLSNAVMFGNYDTAKRLLADGADPNAKVMGGTSLLMFATVRDDKPMVQLLLDHGASPKEEGYQLSAVAQAQNKSEIAAMLKQAAGTSLHELAKEGKTEELLAKLDAGADINALGDHEETLLIAALRGKQSELARLLIGRGADIHIVDKVGHTALISAAMHGDVDETRLLLERGADMTTVDRFGKTALLFAAMGSKTEIVTLLIDAGAKMGPIEAAVLGELETLRMMLNNGADVDTRNAAGMTPLMGAAAGGHDNILTALLIRGADINAVDEQGQTALTYAVTHRHLESVRLLLDQGADINLSGIDRQHARRMEEIVRRHKDAGTEWGQKELQRRGFTPLSIAAGHGDIPTTTLLLEQGANMNAPSGLGGYTPLAFAALVGKTDMVRFLLERGADPTLKDDHGYTALGMAEQSGKHPEVVKILKAAAKTK